MKKILSIVVTFVFASCIHTNVVDDESPLSYAEYFARSEAFRGVRQRNSEAIYRILYNLRDKLNAPVSAAGEPLSSYINQANAMLLVLGDRKLAEFLEQSDDSVRNTMRYLLQPEIIGVRASEVNKVLRNTPDVVPAGILATRAN